MNSVNGQKMPVMSPSEQLVVLEHRYIELCHEHGRVLAELKAYRRVEKEKAERVEK